MGRGWLFALIVVVGAAGCSSDSADAPFTEVRDSLGIRIVEHRLEGVTLPLAAEVGAADLTLGVQEGDPNLAFGRVTAVRSLPDGAIVVADAQDASLKVFEADGRFRARMGGRGGGPGEFTFAPVLAATQSDGIWAWDPAVQRVTRFTPAGDFVDARTLSAQDPSARLLALARLDDSSWVGSARGGGLDRSPGPDGLRLVTDSIVVRRVGPDGAHLDTIAFMAGAELVAGTTDAGGGRLRTLSTTRPFGVTTLFVVDGRGGVTTARTSSIELVAREPTGAVSMIVRVLDARRPLDAADVERLKAQRLAEVESSPDFVRLTQQLFDEIPMPESLPAFSEILVDAIGNYWVAEYATPGLDVTEWIVVSSTGEMEGRASLPAGLRVQEIGAAHVLGVATDELDVQYVRRHPLVRAPVR